MLATHKKLIQDVERLRETVESEPNPSASKKKRYKEAKRMEAKVKAALAEGRIEEDLRDLKLEKVFSKGSTKQAMVARVCYDLFALTLTLTKTVYSRLLSLLSTSTALFTTDLTPPRTPLTFSSPSF